MTTCSEIPAFFFPFGTEVGDRRHDETTDVWEPLTSVIPFPIGPKGYNSIVRYIVITGWGDRRYTLLGADTSQDLATVGYANPEMVPYCCTWGKSTLTKQGRSESKGLRRRVWLPLR